MISRLSPLAAGALALASCVACHAADDIEGYRPERAAMAAHMPVYIVALNPRVRPQIDYPRLAGRAVYVPNTFSNAAGLTAIQAAVGGALGVALGEAAIYSEAKQRAAASHAPLLKARCDLPVDAAGGELGRMLDELHAQRLPPRLPARHRTEDEPSEPAGERAIRALPGGVYVSRNEGGTTALAYRYRLLPRED